MGNAGTRNVASLLQFFPRVSLYTHIDTDARFNPRFNSKRDSRKTFTLYIFDARVVFFFVSRFGFKSERFDANNPPLVLLDENSAKSSSRTRFCEGFHGGDFYYDSHSFFLSQSEENFVEIESDDDDDALE